MKKNKKSYPYLEYMMPSTLTNMLWRSGRSLLILSAFITQPTWSENTYTANTTQILDINKLSDNPAFDMSYTWENLQTHIALRADSIENLKFERISIDEREEFEMSATNVVDPELEIAHVDKGSSLIISVKSNDDRSPCLNVSTKGQDIGNEDISQITTVESVNADVTVELSTKKSALKFKLSECDAGFFSMSQKRFSTSSKTDDIKKPKEENEQTVETVKEEEKLNHVEKPESYHYNEGTHVHHHYY